VSDDAEALDAYSRTVSTVAAALTRHVASVSLSRGGGSAVVFDEQGHLVTNAHVVGDGRRGAATFSDGTETPFEVVGNDPLELSPRRSFAAWSEIVRGTALPWTGSELALGRAFGASLVDIIVQINAVRLLIAEHQLAHIRTMVGSSNEPVVIVDAGGHTLFANDAFAALRRKPQPRSSAGAPAAQRAAELASLFDPSEPVRTILRTVADERHPWRGELALRVDDGSVRPVAVRVEPVAARDGSMLGFFVIFVDLTDSQRVAAARRHLEQSLTQASSDDARPGPRAAGLSPRGDLMSAILANASLAAMDIADGNSAPSVAPLLEELEASTRRATMLYSRIRDAKP